MIINIKNIMEMVISMKQNSPKVNIPLAGQHIVCAYWELSN